MSFRSFAVALAMASAAFVPSSACTGITLKSAGGHTVVARTIEWGGSRLDSRYVIVPRGHVQRSFLPGGARDGMEFKALYGYVGLTVEREEFVAEGLNEAGLSAGLFYFPGYGRYPGYNTMEKDITIADLQLVPLLLGTCSSVDEVVAALKNLYIVGVDSRASTAHWRFADKSGRQIVLEVVDGEQKIYENTLGVLTNSPGFDWHLTNLNNYVNLFPGDAARRRLGSARLAPFGAGSGFLGLPGDMTPPSRFVRAAFYQASAPVCATSRQTVMQCFHILNSFDIPVGIEFAAGSAVPDMPSATQWTTATDLSDLVVYYRTMYDSSIRRIDLKKIRFGRTSYKSFPLDREAVTPVTDVRY